MGQPKLLLPWDKWTLIDQLLYAWTGSAVNQTVVVIREDDEGLRSACARWPVHIVRPLHAPRDMKESVQTGLRFLEQHWHPSDDDRCFIAPADLPGLTSDIINRLIEASADSSCVTIPRFGERQGHPVLLPWPVTQQVFDLPDDQGVNQVVDGNPQLLVPFSPDQFFTDVDTPDEYRRSADSRFPRTSTE